MSESANPFQSPQTTSQPASVDHWGDWLMKWVWLKPPADLAEQTRRRVTLHLIPFLFMLYILAYLDRMNISTAKLGMTLPVEQGGLGFTDKIIGFGASLFFWGYWILEVPSTVSVAKWGARWVFIRILLLWGLCATALGLVGMPILHHLFGWLPQMGGDWGSLAWIPEFINGLRDGKPEQQFYFLRFMLGFFEGGFFPSVIVYISLWFRQQDRAKAIAVFMAAIPVSGALGMPMSGLLLNVRWFGLPGWRWVFILEGILPILAAVATLFCLPKGPTHAKWLANDERHWLTETLATEHQVKKQAGHGVALHHLGMVLLLTSVYFCLNLSSYGFTTWLPTMLEQQGFSKTTAVYLATVPYVVALVAMLLNGWHSDKTRERVWHVAGSLTTFSMGLLIAGLYFNQPMIAVPVMFFVIGACLYTHLPAFWPIPTMFLGATAAASAIGFINMIGNLGGGVGPWLVGELADDKKLYDRALLMLSPWGITASILILAVGYYRKRVHPLPDDRPDSTPLQPE